MTPKTKTINVMLLDGGLGDHIASLVAVNYIATQYPWITPIVWCPDYLTVFAKSILPIMTIYGFSEMRGRYEPTRPTKTTKWDGNTSPMKIHLVDYAFLKLCDENPSIEYKNYLQIGQTISHSFELPKNYVVLTTGFTASVREFIPKEINEIVSFLLSIDHTPIFLGQTQTKTGTIHTIKGSFREDIEFTKGINLIDKTSIIEAATIMQDAKAVLGVDNGLMHLAGCTQTPIIGGFTTVSPNIRMPIRNNMLGWNFQAITPEKSLDCVFCQEKTNFLYGHDYRNCLFKGEPRENLCTKQLTADKFIAALKEIL